MVRGAPPSRSTRPLLVEFEPVATRSLETGALRGIGIGIASSLVLIAVAVGLWRMSLREDRLMVTVERDRRLASLGEMAAVLAHEIRNPLAGMKGHAQLLAERLPAGSREEEKATRIVREAVRLEELSGGLLSFVRSEQVERRDVDPRSLLEEAAREVAAPRIELSCAQAPTSWPLDAPLMQRVFSNLLRNAIEASPDGAPVAATMRVEGSGAIARLVVTVRDRGPGVPAAERERCFEPFFTTKVRGTGLGLAMAQRIVEQHGGTIQVGDHPEGGAVFTVSVPR
jgi:two-component system sensor histidine kinase HydH